MHQASISQFPLVFELPVNAENVSETRAAAEMGGSVGSFTLQTIPKPPSGQEFQHLPPQQEAMPSDAFSPFPRPLLPIC